jgi:hypothetical protein
VRAGAIEFGGPSNTRLAAVHLARGRGVPIANGAPTILANFWQVPRIGAS